MIPNRCPALAQRFKTSKHRNTDLEVLKAAIRVQLEKMIRLNREAIEDTLDAGLPRAYTPELYRAKVSAVFELVYESYPEKDAGVYAAG